MIKLDHLCIILYLLSSSISFQMQLQTQSLNSIEGLAAAFAGQTQIISYDSKTKEGINMDCLKAIKTKNQKIVGVFHSGFEQKTGYSGLYYGLSSNQQWFKITRISQRGSQGYIYQIPNSEGFLILYELQNHQHGNTIAIRYYQNIQKIQGNNFLYQYQLNQIIDNKKIKNIGTPSVQKIILTKQQNDPKYNEYRLSIKFHYCPDGQHDFPGLGTVNIFPLRDFVDQQGNWRGGCKQAYADWSGNSDQDVQIAIRRIGIKGKIGQRDLFELQQKGIVNKYYLYQANLNYEFNWKNWRIILYSEKDKKAIIIPFEFDKVIDLANPHISLFNYDKVNQQYIFWISFFIPSQAITPGSGAKPGQFIGKAVISV